MESHCLGTKDYQADTHLFEYQLFSVTALTDLPLSLVNTYVN